MHVKIALVLYNQIQRLLKRVMLPAILVTIVLTLYKIPLQFMYTISTMILIATFLQTVTLLVFVQGLTILTIHGSHQLVITEEAFLE